jgi:HlyD family secretion protein
MKIAELKRLSNPDSPIASVRGTERQDTAIAAPKRAWYKQRWVHVCVVGGIILAVLVGWLIRAWSNSNHVVSADRLRIVPVANGHFVRDVAAQGTVIAAVNPTLFATAPGTVSYAVRAGDTVTKGQVLATLDSPELNNEYQRERATLDSLNAALSRQEIEIRRQLLTSNAHSSTAWSGFGYRNRSPPRSRRRRPRRRFGHARFQ